MIAAVCALVVLANWYATWQLLQLRHRRPDLVALEERTAAAFLLSAVLTIALVVAILDGAVVEIDDEWAALLGAALFVLAGTPALYWLWTYRRR